MHKEHLFSLPIDNPVLVFLLILCIILTIPFLMRRLRLPSILGLILSGVLIGPHGLHLLRRNSSIILLGTIGLLYIMFLAALELDINGFKKNKNKSIIFGVFTFIFPFVIGFFASKYILGFEDLPATLIASMFSTHTLIAYPIASRLGITNNEVVIVAVGGTIITDTAVLLILAVINGISHGNLSLFFWVKMGVSLAGFGFVIFWGYPKLGKWFFANTEGEKNSHYIFVLAMIFLAAYLAELAGVEAIIGAFMAGLALNSLIPHTSALMNRIEFVGHSLFIPFFLISVGMLVDIRVLFKGPQAIFVALVLTAVALLSKYVAALLTQLLFKYTWVQGQFLFGLSSAHAAATIAVIVIGYENKLVDENVLNGTILLILITCIVASLVAEKFGKLLALEQAEIIHTPPGKSPETLLVAIKNDTSIEPLMDFAAALRSPLSKQPIHALQVVLDNEKAQAWISRSRQILEKVMIHASASDIGVKTISRIDLNAVSGIVRTARERDVSHLILGRTPQPRKSELVFGTTLQQVLANTEKMIFVVTLRAPMHTFTRLVVYIPEKSEFEVGFLNFMESVLRLAKQMGIPICIYSNQITQHVILDYFEQRFISTEAEFKLVAAKDHPVLIAKEIKQDDFVLVLRARWGTISHSATADRATEKLDKFFSSVSYVLVYPEQHTIEAEFENSL